MCRELFIMAKKVFRILGLIVGTISILLSIIMLFHFEVGFSRVILPLIVGTIFVVYAVTGKSSIREFRRTPNSNSVK